MDDFIKFLTDLAGKHLPELDAETSEILEAIELESQSLKMLFICLTVSKPKKFAEAMPLFLEFMNMSMAEITLRKLTEKNQADLVKHEESNTDMQIDGVKLADEKGESLSETGAVYGIVGLKITTKKEQILSQLLDMIDITEDMLSMESLLDMYNKASGERGNISLDDFF